MNIKLILKLTRHFITQLNCYKYFPLYIIFLRKKTCLIAYVLSCLFTPNFVIPQGYAKLSMYSSVLTKIIKNAIIPCFYIISSIY